VLGNERRGTNVEALMVSRSVTVPKKFARLVARMAGELPVTIDAGWGKGNVVLKVAGKIFAILSDDRLVVKLPKARVDEIVERGRGSRFDPRKNGRAMKEWLVPDQPSRSTALVREAYAFVSRRP
jgi:hypothetical protein